jgi:hypothetical protein
MYIYSRPNVYKVLIAFIKTLFPSLEVRQGNQNRAALPNVNDYALVYIHHSNRRGRNERKREKSYDDNDKDIYTETESRTVYAEVLFAGGAALDQAEAFETAFGSADAVRLLGDSGVFPHYIDAIDNAAFINDQDEFNPAYRVYAYLGIKGVLMRDTDTFNNINTTIQVI